MIRVEWPGKDQAASQPKGYVYIIFESEKQVRYKMLVNYFSLLGTKVVRCNKKYRTT
jgi:hypothetical protein